MKNTYSDGIHAVSQLNWCTYVYLYVFECTSSRCCIQKPVSRDISSYAKRNKIAHSISWHSTRVRIIYRITILYSKNKCTSNSFIHLYDSFAQSIFLSIFFTLIVVLRELSLLKQYASAWVREYRIKFSFQFKLLPTLPALFTHNFLHNKTHGIYNVHTT